MASESDIPETMNDFKPPRSKPHNLKKPDISEQPITWANWHEHVVWVNVTFIIVIPLMGLVGAYYHPLQLYTAIFSVIYYLNTGLGITTGALDPKFLTLATFKV